MSQPSPQPPVDSAPQSATIPTRSRRLSALWLVLGFLLPPAGFGLWTAWHARRASDARPAGVGALIGLAAWIIVYAVILFVVLGWTPGAAGGAGVNM